MKSDPGRGEAADRLPCSVSDSLPAGRVERGDLGTPLHPGQAGLLGRYELRRLLGKGGMGWVYLARDIGTGQAVAIKALRPELAGNVRARAYFINEARHMGEMRHPNILPVLAYEESDEGAYLVMPFVAGGNLGEAIRRRGPLGDEEVLGYARQLAGALLYAHQRGIIHRDIKPSNVLAGEGGQVLLSDFGLARTLWNDALTQAGQLQREGTPQYLSPLAAQGHQEDTRSDIYSMGALLYELLSGRPPYEGKTAEEVIARILAGPPPNLREVNPAVAEGLARVVEGAMARELCDRYAHMSYVVEDLDRLAGGKSAESLWASQGQGRPDQTGRRAGLRWWGIGTAALGVAAVLTWLALDGARLRLLHEVEAAGIDDWAKAKPLDFLDNGKPDFYVCGEDTVKVYSLDGQMLRQWAAPEGTTWISVGTRADVNGDGRSETLVGWGTASSWHLSVLNDNMTEIRRIACGGRLAEITGEWGKGYLCPFGMADLEGDGSGEVFGFYFSPEGPWPRQLQAYDFGDGGMRWAFDLAGALDCFIAADLDGDGRREVVCSSLAVDNGACAPDGSEDAYSYVYAFSADGDLLWRYAAGDRYTAPAVQVQDLDRDGRQDVLILVSCDHENRRAEGYSEVGWVVRLDAAGQEMARYDSGGTRLFNLVTVDADDDGELDILAGDRAGRIHWLDCRLQLRKAAPVIPVRFDWVDMWLAGAGDIDGDGRSELVVGSKQVQLVFGHNPGRMDEAPSVRNYHDGRLTVLGRDLKIEGSRQLFRVNDEFAGFHVMLADWDMDGRPEILHLGDKVRVYGWGR